MEDENTTQMFSVKDSTVYLPSNVKLESIECEEDTPVLPALQAPFDYVDSLAPPVLVKRDLTLSDSTDPVVYDASNFRSSNTYFRSPEEQEAPNVDFRMSAVTQHEQIHADSVVLVKREDGCEIKTNSEPTMPSATRQYAVEDSHSPSSGLGALPFPIILYPNQTTRREDSQIDENGGKEIQYSLTDPKISSGDPDVLFTIPPDRYSFDISRDCDVQKARSDEEDSPSKPAVSDSESTRTDNLTVAQLEAPTREKPYICSLCDKQFPSRSAQIIHMRIHVGEKPHICSVCDYRFAHRCDLVKHTRTHTGEKPHMCSQCAYMCSNRYDLTTHMRVHTGEKPHLCSQCAYRCAHRSDLLKHMTKHTGEKPHKCSQCDYKCANKSSLYTHMRIHTGEKPFVCTECPYRSARKAGLVTHTRIHTGEKPFNCSMCDYKSANPSDMARHLRKHGGRARERPYKCSVCEYKSARKYHLNRHMKIHANTISE